MIIMKLVYLDTSNIALLTKLKKDSPKRLKKFLDLWFENKLSLALSDVHLFEIMRYDSKAERQSRFDLIE